MDKEQEPTTYDCIMSVMTLIIVVMSIICCPFLLVVFIILAGRKVDKRQ